MNDTRTQPLSPPIAVGLRPQDMSAAVRCKKRREQLMHQLPRLLRRPDAQLMAGVMMMLMADFHAVLTRSLIERAPAALESFSAIEDLAWLDLQRPAPRTVGTAHRVEQPIRRVVLDDVGVLILDAAARRGAARVADPTQALRAACRELGVEEVTPTQLAQDAKSFWSMRLSRHLVEYASRSDIAPSLAPLDFVRIFGRRRIPQLRRVKTDDPLPTSRIEIPTGSAGSYELQRASLKALMQGLRTHGARPTKSQILAAHQKWESNWLKVGGWPAWIAHWANWELCVERRLQPSSVVRYAESFAKKLVGALHAIEPVGTELHTAELDKAFEQLRVAVATCKSAHVARVALTRFLNWMAAAGGPAIELDDDWQSIGALQVADAQILAPLEYRRTLDLFRGMFDDPDSFPALRLQVILTLGYRTGLRWQEIVTRRLRDILVDRDESDGYVHVRANGFFKGKSASARRKIPLRGLLTADEIAVLDRMLEVCCHVHGAARISDQLVFADLANPDAVPESAPLKAAIVEQLREVTGNERFKFHHLRHSLATFLALRLAWDQRVEPPWAMLPGDAHVHPQALGAPHGAYLPMLANLHPRHASRNYVLGSILGHLSPRESLTHYTHLMDWELSVEVGRHNRWPRSLLAELDGVDADTVRRRSTRWS